jgi:hypothetical protein
VIRLFSEQSGDALNLPGSAYGITSGSLVIDDSDNLRSKSAKALAHLYKLRDKERGAISGDKVSSFSYWCHL